MFVLCFFNDTPPSALYPLSLHDALPILRRFSHTWRNQYISANSPYVNTREPVQPRLSIKLTRGHRSTKDRKSTRLNSSHVKISYAVFCLKKKNIKNRHLKQH